MNQTQPSAIAVVGMSAWYPCGSTLRQFWTNIVARRRAFRNLPAQRLSALYHDDDPIAPDKTYVKRAGVIDGFEFDWVKRRIGKRIYECADITHWLALEMSIQALEDAGYTRETVPTERTGVILGNTLTGEVSRANGLRLRWPYTAGALRHGLESLGYGGQAIDEMLHATETAFKSAFPNITEHTLPGVIANTIAGRVCNYFDMKGGGYVVDGACSSSLIAVARAADALVSGDLDIALAGGVDVSIDPFELVGFAKIGALAKEDMYVYEQRSQGFYPGEGCGWVVLKRLEDARQDGDYIYATLNGWGISSDGRGGLTAPSVDGQAFAIRRAYEKAGYSLADVDFIEGHGTGTAVGDRVELGALARVSEQHNRTKPLGVTALKSLIGHTKAAAGVGSLIKAIAAVNQRVIPPLAHCEKPHDVFSDSQLHPIVDGQVHEKDAVLRGGVSSFGFGGINVHLTIESADEPHPELTPEVNSTALLVSAQDSELFVFQADSFAALREQITPLLDDAAGLSDAELTDLSAHLIASLAEGPIRAAIVAENPDALARKLAALDRMCQIGPAAGEFQSDPTRTVWLSNERTECKVGYLFPGQGSQYLNMGSTLPRRFEQLEEFGRNADEIVTDEKGEALSALINRPTHTASEEDIRKWSSELRETSICQPAICLTSVLYAERLSMFGIRPTAVAGHSLGELTAFWAAGALDFTALMELAQLRGRVMSASPNEAGTMASLRCDAPTAQALCDEVEGYLVVANLNSDGDTVVSGDQAAVRQLVPLAESRDIKCRALPVSNAFHSRYIAAGAEKLADETTLGGQINSLTSRLFSGMDGCEVTVNAPLADHFAEQIVAPVNFVTAASNLAAEVDILLEVGPGRVLSGLVSRISGASDTLCLPVETAPRQTQPFNKALAAVYVLGGEVDLAALHANRYVEPYCSPSERQFIENPCETPLPPVCVPDSFDRSLKGGFESSLPQHTGFDSSTIKQYLEQRSDFLATMIRSDIQSLGAMTGFSAQPISPAAPIETVYLTPKPAPDPTPTSETGMDDSVDEILIELVAERTGFPPESISMEMNLLNDLNIESIAAGEIIGRTSHMAGVGGQIDPGHYLQESLQVIANAIRAVSGGASAGPSKKGFDQSDKTQLLETLHALHDEPTWVHSFAIDLIERELPANAQTVKVGSILIAHSEDALADATSLAETFVSGGATAKAVSFTQLAAQQVPDLLVALVPEAGPGYPDDAQLMRLADALTQSARLMHGAEGALCFVQRGGGVFFSAENHSKSHAPISVSSFAASLHFEQPRLTIRVLDFATTVSVAEVVNRLQQELATEPTFARAGYDAGLIRRIPMPRLITQKQFTPRRISWDSSDVFVVSGGAKGVTAELALTVAETTKAKMVLIGRSPHPGENETDNEIWQTLNRFAEAGLSARYIACDVGDATAVANMVQVVTDEVGAITCLIHGAGVNRPGVVGSDSTDVVVSSLRPKLIGMANLLAALEDSPPKFVVGISSIIGFTGMPGNAWYGLSNEMLERMLFAFHSRHPQTQVLAPAYSLWESVGMGAKMHGVAQSVRAMGTSAIPVAEAVREFMDLLLHDVGTPHVVVAARLGGLDTWCPDLLTIGEGRFLQTVETIQPYVELVTRTKLSLEEDPFLTDHVYKGTCLYPMVFGLEAMAQVAGAIVNQPQFNSVRIDGVDLERPIVVDPTDGVEVLIHARVTRYDSVNQQWYVEVGVASVQTNFKANHFKATFVIPEADAEQPEAQQYAIEHPSNPLAIDPVSDLYGRFLFHGPQFQRLRHFYVLKSDYAVYSVERRQTSYLLGDPFFRDALLQAGQIVIAQDRGLPRSIGSIELFPAAYASQTVDPIVEGVLHEHTDKIVRCTITVTDADGTVLQRLNDCVFSILEHLPDEPTAEEIASPQLRDERLVTEALQGAASSFGVALPAVRLSNMPGLHALAAPERHSREQVVLEQVIDDWQQNNGNGHGNGNGNGKQDGNGVHINGS